MLQRHSLEALEEVGRAGATVRSDNITAMSSPDMDRCLSHRAIDQLPYIFALAAALTAR
jgi:hypothetical protein